MSALLIAAICLTVGAALLVAWLRHGGAASHALAGQDGTLALETRDDEVGQLREDRAQLLRYVGELTVAAARFYAAPTERDVPAILRDTAVVALSPATAFIAVRRKRPLGPGRHWIVAAAHPREGSPLLGAELSWPPSSGGPLEVRRCGRHPMPEILADGQGVAPAPCPTAEWAAPMVVEGEVVGFLGVSSSVCTPALTEAILRSLADCGAIAFKQAVARQRIRSTAQVDELTLLFNRRHILRILSEELRRAQQRGAGLAVFLFDVDHFKHYNDVNGHMAGDILLRLLAEVVQKHVRSSDTVGRFGGEEFLLILPNSTAAQAGKVANSLRALIADSDFPARSQQPLGTLTVSGGIAQFPMHGSSASALLRAADLALYQAKRNGRNRVEIAEVPSLDAHYESADLEEDLD